jgi:hypothetical protein
MRHDFRSGNLATLTDLYSLIPSRLQCSEIFKNAAFSNVTPKSLTTSQSPR